MGHESINGNGYCSTRYLYKSVGERRIARMLDDVGIDYVYEPGLLVNDAGMQRIWYPDFGLPQYGMYLEYFGMVNDPAYDARTRHKLDVYRENKIDVISVYPENLKGNYCGRILNEVHQTMQHRLSDLESKLYNNYQASSYRSHAVNQSYARPGRNYR
jgi:hypothetical protein